MARDSRMVSPTDALADVTMAGTSGRGTTFTGPASGNTASGQAHAPSATAVAAQPPPRVTTVVPATFVPITTDLTRPFDGASRSRVERAQTMLHTVDHYRTGMREGILHLGQLEQERILGDALGGGGDSRHEGHGHSSPPTSDAVDDATTGEIDLMVATMRVPAAPGVDYNITTTQMAHELPLHFPPATEALGGGRRRQTVQQLDNMAEEVLKQLAGCEAHIGTMQQRWAEVLVREQRLLNERFGALPAEGAAAATKEPEDVPMAGT